MEGVGGEAALASAPQGQKSLHPLLAAALAMGGKVTKVIQTQLRIYFIKVIPHTKWPKQHLHDSIPHMARRHRGWASSF